MTSTAAHTNGAARAGTRNVPRGRAVTKDEFERMENPPAWGFTIPSMNEARKPTCTRPSPRRHFPCHDFRVVILAEHDRPPTLPGWAGVETRGRDAIIYGMSRPSFVRPIEP